MADIIDFVFADDFEYPGSGDVEGEILRELVDKRDEDRPDEECHRDITIKIGSMCVICRKSMLDVRILHCMHAFCSGCIEEHYKRNQSCPTCRAGQRRYDVPVHDDGSMLSATVNKLAAKLHPDEVKEAKKRKREYEGYRDKVLDAVEMSAKRVCRVMGTVFSRYIDKSMDSMMDDLNRIKDGHSPNAVDDVDTMCTKMCTEMYAQMIAKLSHDNPGSPVYSPNLPFSPRSPGYAPDM